jgi:tight adherence protein B
LRWLRSNLEGAGLASYGAVPVLVLLATIGVLAGASVYLIFDVVPLGVFIFIGTVALELEWLSTLAKTRRRHVAKLWPEVLDSIHSALSSGLSLMDAFDDLSRRGPQILRQKFEDLSNRLDAGWSLENSLGELKKSIGESHADRLFEVLLLASTSGSESIPKTLRQQSQSLRRDIALSSQIESKQGWVLGTAKLSVAAPWIIVALLSTRSENSAVFNTPSGGAVLLTGFLVCALAYRFVNELGRLPEQPRIFS